MNDDTFMRQKFYKSACWYMCWYEAKPNWDIFIYIRQLHSLFESSPRTNFERAPRRGPFFVSGLPSLRVRHREAAMIMNSLRNVATAGIFALGLFLAPVPTYAAEATDSTASSDIHPDIARADAQREKEAQRKRYLLVFPAAVVVITVGLIVVTRRKR